MLAEVPGSCAAPGELQVGVMVGEMDAVVGFAVADVDVIVGDGDVAKVVQEQSLAPLAAMGQSRGRLVEVADGDVEPRAIVHERPLVVCEAVVRGMDVEDVGDAEEVLAGTEEQEDDDEAYVHGSQVTRPRPAIAVAF